MTRSITICCYKLIRVIETPIVNIAKMKTVFLLFPGLDLKVKDVRVYELEPSMTMDKSVDVAFVQPKTSKSPHVQLH